MSWLSRQMAGVLQEVKRLNPLVHHITNYVTVNDCANVVLAFGGSPIMALDRQEVVEIVSKSAALVLNMGTLTKKGLEAMVLAGKGANEKNIPVILDPVGAGASTFRLSSIQRLMAEVKMTVIRGNMSEIRTLSGIGCKIKGVDAKDSMEDGIEIARKLARRTQGIIAITGDKDIITNGERVLLVENGHSNLTRITGAGCMSTSLVAVCCGVTTDYLIGALTGIAVMGLAGEMAYHCSKESSGIGTFKIKLFDYISLMSERDLKEGARVYEK